MEVTITTVGVTLALGAMLFGVGLTILSNSWEHIPANDPECAQMRAQEPPGSTLVDCGFRKVAWAAWGYPFCIVGGVSLLSGIVMAASRHARANPEMWQVRVKRE